MTSRVNYAQNDRFNLVQDWLLLTTARGKLPANFDEMLRSLDLRNEASATRTP